MKKIAIIGSGPTGIYTAAHLISGSHSLAVTIFESQSEAGKGTPYHQDWNDEQMLANIASIEIPPISKTLFEWVHEQPESILERWGVLKEEFHERTFLPRVALGEYFKHQLYALVGEAESKGNVLTIKTSHKVLDVKMVEEKIEIKFDHNDHPGCESFDYVVMATGHVWPKETEIHPGYFLSPWPATALSTIGNCHVGIRGTSLSGIDAVVALSVARGSFRRNLEGELEYIAEPGTEGFRITMLSRKGLLPEADFYFPIPYEPLDVFTPEAIQSIRTHLPQSELLDAVFLLFKEQLIRCDHDYAQSTRLADVTLEHFSHNYFAEREAHETFSWAAKNLQESKENQENKHTVAWRYAILRMHEVIKDIVPQLTAKDLNRFNKHLKPVFVDNYATVPHESIERLLALHKAGILRVLSVGEDYVVNTKNIAYGAKLVTKEYEMHFPAFIEAMGQRALSVREFPFPSLWEQDVIQSATAEHISFSPLGKRIKRSVEVGGIDLDTSFHPVSDHPLTDHLYCLSIPFMLNQFPFAQGITSSHEMGKQVAEDILHNEAKASSANAEHIQSVALAG